MNDRLTISREDSDAVFAALRAIGWSLRQIRVTGRDNEAAVYVIWNNIDLIRLRLKGQAESATRN
jgi:3-methyladenine DNA glycosylase AlkD